MKNKGIYLALITAFISGLAVFLNKFAVTLWSNSSVFTTAKNLIVVLFLISLIIILKKYSELKNLSRKNWLQLIIIGFIGGSLPFLLFFKGLTIASATTAAFIHKTLFVWVALLAIPILKEKLSKLQIAALGILIIGTYLLAGPLKFGFGVGELLILLATLLWAVENIIAKIALEKISPIIVASGRMFFGSILLIIYLIFSGQFNQIFSLSGEKFSWLLLSGIFLFGYVITWYTALKHAPATAVSAVLTIAAPITAFLNSIFVTHWIKLETIFYNLIIILGVVLIIYFYERARSLLQIRLSS